MNQWGHLNPNFKHGLSCSKDPIYAVWKGIKRRCSNPNDKHFARYGGRGIILCNKWQSPTVFHKWCMANGWKLGLTIERKDNDKGYSPGNCCFIPSIKQAQNRSSTILTATQVNEIRKRWSDGEQQKSLAKEFGVSITNLWHIVHNHIWKE